MQTEMKTKEELLRDLNIVKNYLIKITDLLSKQTEIVANYRQQENYINSKGLKNQSKLIVICIAIFSSLFLLLEKQFIFVGILALSVYSYINPKKKYIGRKIVLGIGMMLIISSVFFIPDAIKHPLGVFFIVASIIISSFIIKHYNKIVKDKNQKIMEHNNILEIEYNETVDRLRTLNSEVYNFSKEWYPKDYYSLEIVNYFINAIDNKRADTIKELINIYINDDYKKKSLESKKRMEMYLTESVINQRGIISELRTMNILGLVSIGLKSSMIASIDRNTNAVNRNTSAINNFKFIF